MLTKPPVSLCPNFMSTYPRLHLISVVYCVLIVQASSNQMKALALVGAFHVI